MKSETAVREVGDCWQSSYCFGGICPCVRLSPCVQKQKKTSDQKLL